MTADAEAPSLDFPGMDAPETYQVLARKYRPRTFADLIGQDAMVRTLTNAFATGRIAHAFMLTGVRGVGKTTTARLLARALNYVSDDVDEPTIALDPPGRLCPAINASRQVDVMEMDAASRTGVGDIREILDGVRYAPVEARYKVYVIDEVHMLSQAAFNALLKTLEEPPSHAKFIFATTEIRKVPVTVLSRCQRFDLRRVEADVLVAHLEGICAKEGASVEADGLRLIARAAEGSVRDALSILDQAIVQGAGESVSAEAARDMLGLADRTRTFDLLQSAARGDSKGVIEELSSQFAAGADPAVILRDLLDHCHDVTRANALGEAAEFSDAADHVARVRTLADELAMGTLARIWQMLLKAHEETRAAPNPAAAAEMALLRIAHAAGLPPPEDVARLLRGTDATDATAAAGGGAAPTDAGGGPRAIAVGERAPPDVAPRPAETPQDEPADAFLPATFEAVAALAEEKRDLMLKTDLDRYVRPVMVEAGRIEFQPTEDAPVDLAQRLSRRLQEWTGRAWLVSPDPRAKGGETLNEKRRREQGERMDDANADPLVAEVKALWPGAEIVSIRPSGDGETDSESGDTN